MVRTWCFTFGARDQSLVGKLRSCKLCSVAKKKKKKERTFMLAIFESSKSLRYPSDTFMCKMISCLKCALNSPPLPFGINDKW